MVVSVQIRGGYKLAEKAEGDVFSHEDSFRLMLQVQEGTESKSNLLVS